MFESQSYLENQRKFLANRPIFPLEELARYAGSWVAWSPDGTRIIASTKDPEEMDNLVRHAGEDPLHCVVEGIPDSDTVIAGGLHTGDS